MVKENEVKLVPYDFYWLWDKQRGMVVGRYIYKSMDWGEVREYFSVPGWEEPVDVASVTVLQRIKKPKLTPVGAFMIKENGHG